ncbi:hypothetical protein [Pseudomonas nitroreducens]|uniref:hypothetical protein n=1 Tax=Pseudomonas nitroreducens TaxID=46680 RepID=UPI003CC82BC0
MTFDVHYIFVESAPSGDVTTWIAIAISILALISTFWQGHLSRVHNKLSVRPQLEGHSQWDGRNYSLEVRNDGLGPAIITDASVYHKSEKLDGEGPPLIEIAFKRIEFCNLMQHEFFYTPFILPAGKAVNIFLVQYDEKIQNIEAYLGELLRLEIEYESAYGEKLPTYKSRNPNKNKAA